MDLGLIRLDKRFPKACFPKQGRGMSKQLAGIALCLWTVILYGRSLGFEFVWDDHTLIRENPYVTSPGMLNTWLTSHLFGATQPNTTPVYYRPLSALTFWIDYRLGQGKPFFFHLVNLLLHALVAWLLFWIVHRISGSISSALMAAGFFCAWPGHTESVSWIAARQDMLMTLGLALVMLALLPRSFLFDRLHPDRIVGLRSPPILLLTAGAIVAIFSKETSIPVLLAILCSLVVTAAFKRYRSRMPHVLIMACCLGVVVASYLCIRQYVLTNMRIDNAFGAFFEFKSSWKAYVAQGMLLVQLLAGFDLRALIALPPDPSLTIYAWLGLCILAAILGWLVFGVVRRRQAEYSHITILLSCALLTLLPACFARIPALRYLYAPLFFLCIAMGIVLAKLTAVRRWRLLSRSLLGMVCLCHIALGQLRIGAWQSDETLFAIEAAINETNPDAQYFYGELLMSQSRILKAREHFERSLRLDPGHRPSYLGLASSFLATREFQQAERIIRFSLRGTPQTAPQYFVLGSALEGQNRNDEALRAFEAGFRLGGVSPSEHIRQLYSRMKQNLTHQH